MKAVPKKKKGFRFTGWAVFNWGTSLDIVFRTRKEARKEISSWFEEPNEWKKYYTIQKVKCTVL